MLRSWSLRNLSTFFHALRWHGRCIQHSVFEHCSRQGDSCGKVRVVVFVERHVIDFKFVLASDAVIKASSYFHWYRVSAVSSFIYILFLRLCQLQSLPFTSSFPNTSGAYALVQHGVGLQASSHGE